MHGNSRRALTFRWRADALRARLNSDVRPHETMRFRVAAVQDEGLPPSLNDARLWLEEWLNESLQDADFGCPGVCIMIVVFATVSLPKAPPVSRLSTSDAGASILALHVAIAPSLVEQTPSTSHLALLCKEIVRGLPAKPLRKPKGLEFERLRKALVSCIEPFATSAT